MSKKKRDSLDSLAKKEQCAYTALPNIYARLTVETQNDGRRKTH